MSVEFLVLNAAYLALLASTFTRTVTVLRCMLVLAAIAFIIYGSIEGIRSMVAWNVVIGGMHLFRIARDYRQQRLVALDDHECSLRDEFFPGLADFDFHVLWSMGDQAEMRDQMMIAEGTVPDCVSLIIDGTVLIEKQGKTTRGLRRGALVGEMSMVSGIPADVDVRCNGTVVVRQWDKRKLAALDQLHPASGRAFRELLAKNLAEKVRV